MTFLNFPNKSDSAGTTWSRPASPHHSANISVKSRTSCRRFQKKLPRGILFLLPLFFHPRLTVLNVSELLQFLNFIYRVFISKQHYTVWNNWPAIKLPYFIKFFQFSLMLSIKSQSDEKVYVFLGNVKNSTDEQQKNCEKDFLRLYSRTVTVLSIKIDVSKIFHSISRFQKKLIFVFGNFERFYWWETKKFESNFP